LIGDSQATVKMEQGLIQNADEEVLLALERQMLPIWMRYGLDRVVMCADTQTEFEAHSLPPGVDVFPQASPLSKSVKHRNSVDNGAIIESWPERDQESIRWPVLIFVRSGHTEITIGDCIVSCPEGHFLFLPSGVPQPAGLLPHTLEPHEGKNCELWWFRQNGSPGNVTLSVCYSRGKQHINSGHYYIVGEPRVAELFNLFALELNERLPHYAVASVAILQSFFLLFAREIAAGRYYDCDINPPPKSSTLTISPIEAAVQYIDKNIHQPLTIDIVAQAVFMSRTKFIQEFREHTGQTFREYLTERRLQQAQYWLGQKGYPIQVISRLVGLKHSRFHQLYRQHYGVTPAQYRKQIKND